MLTQFIGYNHSLFTRIGFFILFFLCVCVYICVCVSVFMVEIIMCMKIEVTLLFYFVVDLV